MTFFLASLSSALGSWIFTHTYRAAWEMLQVPSGTGICISMGSGVEGGQAEALLGVSGLANEDTLQNPASGCSFAILEVSQHWQ